LKIEIICIKTYKYIKKKFLHKIKTFHTPSKNPNTEKKRILRLMIKDVTLNKNDKIVIQIRWVGGATTIKEIPIPLSAPQDGQIPEKTLNRIKELSIDHTPNQVVNLLNSEGYKTGTKKQFTLANFNRIVRKYNQN